MQVLFYFAGHGHEKDNVPQLCGIGWKDIDFDEDVIDPLKKSGKNLFTLALVDCCRVHDEDDVSESSAPAPAVHGVVAGNTPVLQDSVLVAAIVGCKPSSAPAQELVNSCKATSWYMDTADFEFGSSV